MKDNLEQFSSEEGIPPLAYIEGPEGLNPQFNLNLLNPDTIRNHIDQVINHRNETPDDLSYCIIHMSDTYPEIDFLFKRAGVGCISIGDIIVLKGKAKGGKTTYIIVLISALLIGYYMGFESSKKNPIILFIDTEQNPVNTSILARKVHSLCGFSESQDHPQFQVCNTRSIGSSQICNFILSRVRDVKPDLLIIDGVRDLIKGGDINDQKASEKVSQFLMSLTKQFNLALITVLHENKGDSNLRGAIGTELLNKCSECWQVKKIGDKFQAEQTESRNEPVSGFSFKFNDEKLPVPVERAFRMSASEDKDQKMPDNFKQCLPQGVSIRYSDLKNKYVELTSFKPGTAESHIKNAVKDEYLIKDNNGNYFFNYHRK